MSTPVGKIVQLCAINPDGKTRAIECDSDDILFVSQTASGVWVVKQTDPDLLKSLIHGDDSGGSPQPLQVDGNKSLFVAQKSGDEWEIKQQTPGDLMPGIHSYGASDWQKQPLIWSYSDRLVEVVSDTNLSAGTNNLDGTAVPANEIWVVTGVALLVVSGSITSVILWGNMGGTLSLVYNLTSPVSGRYYSAMRQVVLKEDDFLRLTVYAATAGDDAYLRYYGYKMEIAL